MGKHCMKCGTETPHLVYIREWRERGHHWVCERCERAHNRRHPEMMVPFEISKANKGKK